MPKPVKRVQARPAKMVGRNHHPEYSSGKDKASGIVFESKLKKRKNKRASSKAGRKASRKGK